LRLPGKLRIFAAIRVIKRRSDDGEARQRGA